MKAFIIGLLLFIAHPVWSMDLYQAQVVVADTTEEHRLPALKQVLQSVLMKLTGIHKIELTAEDTNDIEQWIKQFSYKSEIGQVWLEASFDHQEINQLLEKLGLKVWQQPRPIILAWVVHHDEVINAIQQVNRMQILKAKAETQGIEVIFPILDLYERRAFPVKQVENYRQIDIQNLTERYAVETVLIGHFTTEQQANWQLFHQDEQTKWQTEGQQINHLLQSGIGHAISKIAPQSVQAVNAIVDNQPKPEQPKAEPTITQLSLTISDVPNLTAYAKINRYLQQLAEVQDIEMKNMSSNQLQFDITVKTTQEQFAQILQASRLIQVQSQAENKITGRFQESL